ncbi:glycosyltransferase [Vreelandella aquamarina]|uniref:glycosyltransferase n=1 Tax=Vreelandella aquamarina TaxID=77097 RepID=UPI003D07EFDE
MTRLVMDLQIAQAEPESVQASIMIALAKQLAAMAPDNVELLLVLSAALPGTIEPLRGEFHDLLPQRQLRVWYPPEELAPAEQGSHGLRGVAERLHQAFIAEMQSDLVILPGLWHGWQDHSVVSLDSGPLAPTAAVLLPGKEELAVPEAVDPDRYAWHKQCLEQLRRASYLLEVPGLTVAPDDLEGLQDVECIRLPVHHEHDTEALAEAANRLWELANKKHSERFEQQVPKSSANRLRLAYVSPLPPEQTGIGYYSAELLPELARYYDIDVVVEQGSVENDWINDHCGIRSVSWFERHGHEYERVVYQFGNSRFHAHMWDLIEKVPGVAVVHDFYLGDAVAYREDGAGVGLALPRELYHSHGYAALKPLILEGSRPKAIRQFPCSYSPIREAKGVIVHSRHAQELATAWYGEGVAEAFHVIPHLRELPEISPEQRKLARERLGIDQNAFVICSFGVVNKTKLPHRLFSAWQNAELRHDPEARLVFVGETPDEHGKRLRQEVEASEYGERISFTGWAESDTFQDYLAAADVAVQLRTNSRGETSGTVLDCMAHGVATICNAHGSFAEVPEEGVWKLEDRFEDNALIEALDTLWQDAARRRALGREARAQIQRHYSPAYCGERYYQAIEDAYLTPSRQRHEVVKCAINHLPEAELNERLAASIGSTLPLRSPQQQLLVDVSVVAREDLRTGVQRVVRSILSQLLEADLPGVRIEPVYTNPGMEGYFYAREFTQQFMGGHLSVLPDEPMEAHCGDIFLGLDLHGDGIQAQCSYLEGLRGRGIKVVFVVHDLLPVTHPHWFPAAEEQNFENWLHCITRFDGAICVSQTTADELEKWMTSRDVQRHRPYLLGVAHNGADIRQSVPSMGLPDDAEEVLAKLRTKPSFLMVGTVEPRKGVTQVLDAFELLWQQGYDFNLVLVGKRGWNIDELAERLEQHEENHRRLFWLRGISDEYLERVYADSTCLIAGSEGEGFGLPLIEAAQQEIPILARDIPVFREVAGNYAEYFSGISPEVFSEEISSWLERHKRGKVRCSKGLPYNTWKKTSEQYLSFILELK